MAKALIGDFGHRMVVGSFAPDPVTMLVDKELHGLSVQSTYLYGFFRDDKGLTYCTERKFVGSLTSGCFIMTQNGDPNAELDVHGDTGRTARGEVRRTLDGGERTWSEPVYQRLPSGITPSGEQSVSVRWTGDTLTYDEGDILSLEGISAGHGVQFFSVSLGQPLLYASMCYWMEGTIHGKHVEGPIWYDPLYFRHGLDWKDYGYFTKAQIMETDFCNKFEDGTFEWGRLISGFDGYTPGVVIRGDEVFAMTPDLKAVYGLDDDNWPTDALYDVAGEQYEFTGPKTGRMTQFSESRWAGYRAQYGQVRRVGDDKVVTAGLAWVEGFGNRIVESGLAR